MGMSASQVNLLSLVSRKADLEYMSQNIATQRGALTRDMQRVTKKYKEALSQKSIKWTNDGGINYIDMTYKNLMQPCVTNQQQPYIISDLAGKVVVDSRYRQYAELISPDGSPGGNWESVRAFVIAQLTGFDEEDMEEYVALERAALETQYIFDHTSEDSEDFDTVKENRDLAQDAWNQHKNYPDETKIAFYEQIFKAIADCGWVYDSEIGDSDRLNQMFQNNIYTITTIDRDYDEHGEYTNCYNTDIASNCTHAVLVNDSVANADALAEYEYQKSIINSKEINLDNRQNQIDTEMNAIKTEIDGIKQVMNDNVQKHFATFNG